MVYDDYHHTEKVVEERKAYINDFENELKLNGYKPPKKFLKKDYYSYAMKKLMENDSYDKLSKKYDINRKTIFSSIITDYSTFGITLGRKKILKHPFVYEYQKDGAIVEVSSEFGTYNFRPILNSLLDDSIIKIDQLSKIERISLYSGKNIGNCHLLSIKMCPNDNAETVTGLINDHLNNHKMCHSWIEINQNDEIYVLDFCFNLIMKQSDYYKLFDATIYSRIDKESIIKDITLFREREVSPELRDYLMEREKTLLLTKKITSLK